MSLSDACILAGVICGFVAALFYSSKKKKGDPHE